jgi:hypothetical protein
MEYIDPELFEYISRQDAPCPGCRYNLRGLHSALCPECGFEFTLKQLQEHQAAFELEQQVWLKRVGAIRVQLILLAVILVANVASMMFLIQGVSIGKRLQISFFIVLIIAVELLVLIPFTSKKRSESELTCYIVYKCEQGLGAVMLVALLPVIISVLYLILWAMGYV